MSVPKKKVLIVEDQFLAAEFLRIWTEAHGFDVCGNARSAAEAIELALQHRPQIILMDMRLQGEADGVDAAMAIFAQFETRLIYCTGSSEPSTIKRINEDHPFAIIIKPVDPEELGRVLNA